MTKKLSQLFYVARYINAFVLVQVFAIDLISHLSVQYALPKSLAIAKLAINVMSTMIGGELNVYFILR